MDGNRRYSKKNNCGKATGYKLGSQSLGELIKFCHYSAIKEITIFAFSIENFKRDQSEIDLLMGMAIEKLSLLLDEKEELIKHDACIRFVGNLNLLPIKLQKIASELMLLTRDHKARCLNVCIAYTSSDELSSASNKLYDAYCQNILDEEISKENLNTCLYTNRSTSNPDLLIR